jgi:hypothetical protein
MAAWESAAAAAREAFAAPGALRRSVELSYGRRPADGYCQEMAMDLTVQLPSAQRRPNVEPRDSVVRFTVDPRPGLASRAEGDLWLECAAGVDDDVGVSSGLVVMRCWATASGWVLTRGTAACSAGACSTAAGVAV